MESGSILHKINIIYNENAVYCFRSKLLKTTNCLMFYVKRHDTAIMDNLQYLGTVFPIDKRNIVEL
jgi:hypothetical protein